MSLLEIDADDKIAGAVKIEDASGALFGYVVSGDVVGGDCRVLAVGGAGGFSTSAKDLPARSYLGVTARSVASDIVESAGERLSSSSNQLSASLPYWTRSAGRASTALSSLADALALKWRVLRDGSVWFGQDAWPPMEATYDADELDHDPASGTVLLAPDTIALRPGVTYGGHRVGRVEHLLKRDEPLRTTFWTAS